MLTDFAFTNYRAFRRGHVFLKPLTIVVGANSVGKTALLQIPLLIKQTAVLGDSKFRGALRIYGRDVSFGRPDQIYNNLNTSVDLEIEIGFRSGPLLTEYRDDITHQCVRSVLFHCENSVLFSAPSKRTDQIASKFDAANSKQYAIYKKLLENFAKGENKYYRRISLEDLREMLGVIDAVAFIYKFFKPDETEKGSDNVSLGRKIPAYILHARLGDSAPSFSESDVKRMMHYAIMLRELKSDNFSVRYAIGYKTAVEDKTNGTLVVTNIAIKTSDKIIFGLSIDKGKIVSVSSELNDDKLNTNRINELSKDLLLNGSIFDVFGKVSSSIEPTNSIGVIRRVMSAAIRELRQNFSGSAIEHIGPLRAHPKRYYFLDQNYSVHSGETVVEKLLGNPELVDKVNFWLKKFKITITVGQLVEIISRIAIRNERASYELDITDVGFGISQFLPILVEGLLAPAQRMLIVEQPEIHLHPKMQSELADFLIDVANIRNDKNKPNVEKRIILVETHSAYILNRVRRRISEGEIKHSDVAIYFVEAAGPDDSSTVRGVNIPANGNFEWPKEFYSDELEDALAFFANAGRVSK